MSSPTAPAARPKQVSLIVVNPSGHRRRVPLLSCPFGIGRHADNDLAIRDNRISRNHARIVRENDDYFIEDLKSMHGVYVNGERVSRRQLQSSDVVNFGFDDSYQLTFVVEEGELSRLLGQFPSPRKDAPAGAENLAKLRAVVEVARALQSSLSTEEVLDAVVDAALTVTGSERGFLLLRDKEELDIRVARDQSGAYIAREDLKVPTRLIGRALRERRELLSMNFDPSAETGAHPDASVANLELRSAVCVPLVRVRTADIQETMRASLNETLGLIYLDSRVDVADLSSGNRELLQSLALEASTVLENARLLDEERARQKLEEELNIARSIQQGLLPSQLPTTGWFRAAGSSIASHQVGGDYFDAIRVNPDCWSTMVADVSGKGVSSALLASLLQGAFLRAAETDDQIREMLERMNQFLLERTAGEKYATLFYCILTSDGLLRWSNAAHCAPVVIHRDGSMELLDPSGMPVGLIDIATYEVRTTQLSPGDKLVIYSDGYTEARNEQGDFFELQPMLNLIREHSAASCTELHDTLMDRLRAFTGEAEQSDDTTLVVVEYLPA